MAPWETALAVLVLLLTPGPTNTLLALAGAERGMGALRLVPAELAGYLLTVVPLAFLGARLLDAAPGARPVLTGLAAAWVLWLALGLWRGPRGEDRAAITARRVAVTTLLNPKALVFGLALLPAPDLLGTGLNLLMFAAQVVGVAALWAGLGATLRRGAPTLLLRRAAAVWLVLLSAWLASRLA